MTKIQAKPEFYGLPRFDFVSARNDGVTDEVRFCYEFDKAKYFRAIFGVVERATREHSRAYVTAVAREHSTKRAEKTSRFCG